MTSQPFHDTQLGRGVDQIKTYAKQLPLHPGVYRMLNERGDVLYVGKARQLKKRVLSYTRIDGLTDRLKRMVAQVTSVDITLTNTEAEALLLESNLIKRFRPPFNILLRDDKSFAYITLSKHEWPRLTKHRGEKGEDQYFGPFASVNALDQTLEILYRVFKLRSCKDTEFHHRKRPCLQYFIGRCSAPCVQYISKEDYQDCIRQAKEFLTGKSTKVSEQIALKMQEASQEMNYEAAARYRDQLKSLSAIQQHQDINVQEIHDADILALAMDHGQACIQVFFFRGGCNFGNRSFFPRHDVEDTPQKILSAFIIQFYENLPPPPLILLSHKPEEEALLQETLQGKHRKTIRLFMPLRGLKYSLVEIAIKNAQESLERHLALLQSMRDLRGRVKEIFSLPRVPERIEIYDNSHLQGTHAYGAMVVAGKEGFIKSAYRRYKIPTDPLTKGGNDYEMLAYVLKRRFAHKDQAEQKPDLILIDGGKGHLHVAIDVLAELGITDIKVVAIAKGPQRNAGHEWFFPEGRDPFQLPKNDPALYYLQRLRDEAHRFAIGTHRQKRIKVLGQSLLDSIPGIGPRRKKALLQYFGSVQGIKGAGVRDLAKVKGISKDMAENIFKYLHES